MIAICYIMKILSRHYFFCPTTTTVSLLMAAVCTCSRLEEQEKLVTAEGLYRRALSLDDTNPEAKEALHKITETIQVSGPHFTRSHTHPHTQTGASCKQDSLLLLLFQSQRWLIDATLQFFIHDLVVPSVTAFNTELARTMNTRICKGKTCIIKFVSVLLYI